MHVSGWFLGDKHQVVGSLEHSWGKCLKLIGVDCFSFADFAIAIGIDEGIRIYLGLEDETYTRFLVGVTLLSLD